MPKALAVVAHHDDHILWMGGTIQRMKAQGWDWTLIAMCVPHNDRQPYYCSCCNALGGYGCYLEFRDYQSGSPFSINQRAEMEAELLNAIPETAFDYVFTHSRDKHGEYGFHANHAEVAEVVRSLVARNKIACEINHLAYFSYEAIYGGAGKATVARLDATYYCQLRYPELMLKCEWCNKAPDVNNNLAKLGFPCPNPEAFEGDNLSLPPPFIRGDRAKP